MKNKILLSIALILIIIFGIVFYIKWGESQLISLLPKNIEGYKNISYNTKGNSLIHATFNPESDANKCIDYIEVIVKRFGTLEERQELINIDYYVFSTETRVLSLKNKQVYSGYYDLCCGEKPKAFVGWNTFIGWSENNYYIEVYANAAKPFCDKEQMFAITKNFAEAVIK